MFRPSSEVEAYRYADSNLRRLSTHLSWFPLRHLLHGLDNGLVVANYSDGSADTLHLTNPYNWCPIEQDYYYDAVLWAVENGITAGTSKTTFSPNETCTRGQIVTFLFRSENS